MSKYGQVSERYRKYFERNPRHYAETREGIQWRAACGELVPTKHRATDMLFVDCEACRCALDEINEDTMSDIQSVYDSIRAAADNHDDPRGPYAQGLRAAADRLRGLLPASPPKATQAPDPAPVAPPEPTSADDGEAKQTFKPPVGTFGKKRKSQAKPGSE